MAELQEGETGRIEARGDAVDSQRGDTRGARAEVRITPQPQLQISFLLSLPLNVPLIHIFMVKCIWC